MGEKLVSFEVAKLAKKKGFDVKAQWLKLHLLDTDHNVVSEISASKICLPTQSLLQKYLREVHNIVVFVAPVIPLCKEWGVTIYFGNELKSYEESVGFYTSYEEALETGLLNALKLI